MRFVLILFLTPWLIAPGDPRPRGSYWSSGSELYQCEVQEYTRIDRTNGDHKPTIGVGKEIPDRLRIVSYHQVDAIQTGGQTAMKEKFLSGEYEPDALDGIIFGWYDSARQIYILGDGRNRMTAALHIAHENSDWTFVRMLIQHGNWHTTPYAEQYKESYPFHVFTYLQDQRDTVLQITPEALRPAEDPPPRKWHGRFIKRYLFGF